MEVDKDAISYKDLEMFVEQFHQTHFYIQEMAEEYQRKASGDMTQVSPDLNISIDPNNPGSAEADMRYFKDLFSKLKFNYLEQESKEKFLTGILDDPPLVVRSEDNHDLELSLETQKTTLKATKVELETTKKEIEQLSEVVCSKYEKVAADAQVLSTLLSEIQEMNLELASINAQNNGEEKMTINEAQQIVQQQSSEMQEFNQKINQRRAEITQMKREIETTQAQMSSLQSEKTKEESFAAEAIRTAKTLDPKIAELCKWYSSSYRIMLSLLDIESIKLSDDGELEVIYQRPQASVSIYMDPQTKKILNAKVSNKTCNIALAVERARETNDIYFLMQQIRIILERQ